MINKKALVLLSLPFVLLLALKARPVHYIKNGVYDSLFNEYGDEFNISPATLKAMAIVESSLNPFAKNPKSSATGLMQMTKAACSDVGERWDQQTNPRVSVRSAAKYLALIKSRRSLNNVEMVQSYYAGDKTMYDGNNGIPFTGKWKSDAYRYAIDVYQPKVASIAERVIKKDNGINK